MAYTDYFSGGSYANPFNADLEQQVKNTPLGIDSLEANGGQGAWGLLGSRYGGGQPFQKWLSGQYSKEHERYLGEAALHPGSGMDFFHYLSNRDFGTDFNNLPAYDRGESPPSVFAPRAKFTGY